MLNFLHRSCIITILSCALITQSFAETAPAPAAVPASNSSSTTIGAVHDNFVNGLSNGQTTTTKEGVVIDKTGNQTTTKKATVEGKEFKPDMLNSVTMAIIGLLAVKLVFYLPPTMDTMFAAGAGASFIIGELSSSKDVAKFEKEIAYRSDGKVNNDQLAAVQKMKAALEEARDSVKKKKMFQNIAFLAFGAATLIALYQAYQVNSLGAICDASVKAGAVAGPMAALCAPAVVPAANLGVQINITLPKPSAVEKTWFESLMAWLTGASSACPPATAQCAAYVAYIQTIIPGGFPIVLGHNDILRPQLFTPFAPIETQLVAENKSNSKFLEQISNLFISKAEAGQMELLFGVGGGIAAALIIGKSLGVMVDTFMALPIKRALVWGVLAGMTKLAVDSSQKIIDELETQIKQVEGIIASMTGAGGGLAGVAEVAVSAVMPVFATSGGGFVSSTGDGSNIPCVTSTATSNCPSLTKALVNAPEWKALPADVQGLAMGVGTFMNKVQGKPGVTGDAMGSGVALNGSASGMNKMLANARGNVNAQLRKMGQPGVDFNKAQNDILKQMNQATADGLKQSGMSASGFLASMGGANAGGTAAVKKPEAPSQTFAKSKLAPVGGGAAAAPKGPMYNFKEDKPALEVGAEVAGGKNEVYEMSAKSDISADAGGSIFNLISERYFKSAYPKLLEESPAPAADPASVKK